MTDLFVNKEQRDKNLVMVIYAYSCIGQEINNEKYLYYSYNKNLDSFISKMEPQ